MAVIAVFNQKGGVGKTTTVINVAVCLSSAGVPVTVVDFDSQGNATTALGCRPPPTHGSYELLADPDCPSPLVGTRIPNISLFASSDHLAGIDFELAAEDSPQFLLRRRLARFDPDQGVTLIDCPPSLGILPVNALVAADWLVIPVVPETFSFDGLFKVLDNIRRIRSRLRTGIKGLSLLLTRTIEDEQHFRLIEAVRNAFGGQVMATEIPEDPAVLAAHDQDSPLCMFRPGSAAARAYRQATSELVDRINAALASEDGEGDRLRGLEAYLPLADQLAMLDQAERGMPNKPNVAMVLDDVYAPRDHAEDRTEQAYRESFSSAASRDEEDDEIDFLTLVRAYRSQMAAAACGVGVGFLLGFLLT